LLLLVCSTTHIRHPQQNVALLCYPPTSSIIYWCQHKHTKTTHSSRPRRSAPTTGRATRLHGCRGTTSRRQWRALPYPPLPPLVGRGRPPTCGCRQQRREMKSALTSPCPCPCPTVPVRRTTRGRSVQSSGGDLFVAHGPMAGAAGRAGVIVVMSMHVDVATLVLCGLVASL
jgi:hypothetical protein